MNMIKALEEWFLLNHEKLRQSGVDGRFAKGPNNLDKSAAWLDLETQTTLGRMIVWETGEADLEVGDVSTGHVHPIHRTLRSTVELHQSIDELVSAVTQNRELQE
jgi:hypothetical protein